MLGDFLIADAGEQQLPWSQLMAGWDQAVGLPRAGDELICQHDG